MLIRKDNIYRDVSPAEAVRFKALGYEEVKPDKEKATPPKKVKKTGE